MIKTLMKKAPIPKNEFERIQSVQALGILDTPPEERFDKLTRAATLIFHVPISTLTIIDAQREWFKSCQGLAQKEGDRAISFCGHALVENEMLVVTDAAKDERFADNPMVIGDPHIRFYAGVPIVGADGRRIGVFCIKDTKPREFSPEDREILEGLASWAELEINLRNVMLTVAQQQKIIEKYIGENQ
jgi:GAF domain-containing protein